MQDLYLAHHGVLGQKWGVRRYQNPDGTLTELGLKKYRKVYDSLKTTQRDGDASTIKYNQKHFKRLYDSNMKYLINKIGDIGINQIEEQIIKEGEAYALKAAKSVEESYKKTNREVDLINKDLISKYGKDETYKVRTENEMFKKSPEEISKLSKTMYDRKYNDYVNPKLLNRGANKALRR